MLGLLYLGWFAYLRFVQSLTCPACPKTAFPSLQAYVNHVRISHGLYFPSHAEAVRTLGKQVSPEQAVELRVKASAYAEKLKREMDVARVDTLGRRVPITQQQLSVRRERPDPIAPKEKEKKVKVRGQFTRRRRDGVEVLIACPECGRDDISTMQGFIKHLGTHGIPQLSVDDAIDLYGVPINNAGSASGENEAMMVVSRAPAKKVSPLSLAAQDVKVESEYGSVGPGTPETGYGTEDGTVADAALWELRVPRSDGVIVR